MVLQLRLTLIPFLNSVYGAANPKRSEIIQKNKKINYVAHYYDILSLGGFYNGIIGPKVIEEVPQKISVDQVSSVAFEIQNMFCGTSSICFPVYGGFSQVVEFHRKGSATNGVTPSSFCST